MLAFWKKNKTTAAGMLGLAPTADGLALARLHWQAGVPRLQSCAFLAASADAQPGALQQYVEREGLAGLSVNLLAASNDYQMLLVERPEVADSELRDAVRWRIRELVSQPVDGLVVDAFALPADAFRGRTPMVYCAALARTRMNELAALCESAGLRLASIDVAELALRNLGLLTGAQGEELSKRLGTLSLRDLRARGVEPMALLSLMARLGSSKPVELASSIDELAEGFDVESFGAAPTKFDAEDLFPLTRGVVQGFSFDKVKDRIAALGVPEEEAEGFWAIAKGNITVLDDLAGWWKLFSEGAAPVVDEADRDFVVQALALLPAQPWTTATWGEWTGAVKAATGRKGKDLFMPLRKALTGQAHGPDMSELMPHLRKRPVM